MLDLHEQRKQPGDHAEVKLIQLPEVDLTTVRIGDWIEGVGDINTYGMVGFLHQLGYLGLHITPIDNNGHVL